MKKRLQVATHRLLLLAGFWLAFAVRLYHLGAESLWYDETVSVYLARKSLADMIAHTAGDIHPPGYYVLLHGWHLLTQPTLTHGFEFLYAWPSLFFGVLILALLYCLGRLLFNKEVALLAVWLAALHPFQVWYGQEVRMYTLGATLGLLCLWALLQVIPLPQFRDRKHRAQQLTGFQQWRWLTIYALTAAVGMYTLYYFLFLLAGLNLLVLYLWGRSARSGAGRFSLWPWLLAQLAIPVLFAPWLAIFYRQVTDPPVPPWRVAWGTLAGFSESVSESLCALLFGQSPPYQITWPWAILAGLILLGVIGLRLWLTANKQQSNPSEDHFDVGYAIDLLLLYTFTPIVIIYIVTYFITPLYHVRYLFTYSPLFVLLLAYLVSQLGRTIFWKELVVVNGSEPSGKVWPGKALFAIAITLLTLGNSFSLYEFWYNPTYQADDHRAAVAELAANWRPGDVILVNAGWPYTALELYWPNEINRAQDSVPPNDLQRRRLISTTRNSSHNSISLQQPPSDTPVQIVTSGSIDGPPSLGWNNPVSDFYAISASEAISALQQLIEQHPRIWHYRLYDTVSDPSGLLRARLSSRTRQWWEKPYPGRDYLRLQLFAGSQALPETDTPIVDNAQFGSELHLLNHHAPQSIAAGEILYSELRWEVLANLAQSQTDLTMSLRLYDPTGELLAQQDAVALPPTSQWSRATRQRQPLAIGVPVATKPGVYDLEVVVYHTGSGEPLSVTANSNQAAERAIYGQRWQLGEVQVQPARRTPELPTPLARFDYIELISATPDRQEARPGEALSFELVWRPRPSSYRDRYDVVLSLRTTAADPIENPLAQWSATLGGDDYPSSEWLDNLPVRQRQQIMLPSELPVGKYKFTLQMVRSSDGLVIAAESGWGWRQKKFIVISELATR